MTPGVASLWLPPVVHHVLGGGQPDDEEVQDDEEPGRLLRQLGEEGRLAAPGEQRGVAGENELVFVPTEKTEQLLIVFFFSRLCDKTSCFVMEIIAD